MIQRFKRGSTNDNVALPLLSTLQAMSVNHFSCLMDDPICENYIVSIQPNSGQFGPDGQTPLPLELSVFIITFTNSQLQYNITLCIKHLSNNIQHVDDWLYSLSDAQSSKQIRSLFIPAQCVFLWLVKRQIQSEIW